MAKVFLTDYEVSGIKCINKTVAPAFYKKQISKNPDTQGYNLKAIYGENGSGKSGIITSVDILKKLLLNPTYLSNDLIQAHLQELINKETGELKITAQYFVGQDDPDLYRYSIELTKDTNGCFMIQKETLQTKKAASRKVFQTLFHVEDGSIASLPSSLGEELIEKIVDRTKNLLSRSCFISVLTDQINEFHPSRKEDKEFLQKILSLYVFGQSISVFLGKEDKYHNFPIPNVILGKGLWLNTKKIDQPVEFQSFQTRNLYIGENIVPKSEFSEFQATVQHLSLFLKVFQKSLKDIEIDRKEDKEYYRCFLMMKYPSYDISSEYESTGIKKLISLFPYLKSMYQGAIVFVDELDSNLHDVYLCALLKYLMHYGQGQLCFTTHNVGPMDVLKQNKKSIDFLCEDHRIYPWIKNGNYSPSKLYREGMIAGSPFNIDSIDFIGCFD